MVLPVTRGQVGPCVGLCFCMVAVLLTIGRAFAPVLVAMSCVAEVRGSAFEGPTELICWLNTSGARAPKHSVPVWRGLSMYVLQTPCSQSSTSVHDTFCSWESGPVSRTPACHLSLRDFFTEGCYATQVHLWLGCHVTQNLCS